MDDYKHAVASAIKTELTNMFITHEALTFINKADIPPDAVFFKFFMFLCAMEATPPPADAETAYAATGDHHLFTLTLNAVLAAAIQDGFPDKLEFMRYDVLAAFLQCKLPVPYYDRLPADLTLQWSVCQDPPLHLWRPHFEQYL